MPKVPVTFHLELRVLVGHPATAKSKRRPPWERRGNPLWTLYPVEEMFIWLPA